MNEQTENKSFIVEGVKCPTCGGEVYAWYTEAVFGMSETGAWQVECNVNGCNWQNQFSFPDPESITEFYKPSEKMASEFRKVSEVKVISELILTDNKGRSAYKMEVTSFNYRPTIIRFIRLEDKAVVYEHELGGIIFGLTKIRDFLTEVIFKITSDSDFDITRQKLDKDSISADT